MKDFEDMTIKEIRFESQNIQYDLENYIKEIFKNHEFINTLKIRIGKLYLDINRKDVDIINVEPIINIKI